MEKVNIPTGVEIRKDVREIRKANPAVEDFFRQSRMIKNSWFRKFGHFNRLCTLLLKMQTSEAEKFLSCASNEIDVRKLLDVLHEIKNKQGSIEAISQNVLNEMIEKETARYRLNLYELYVRTYFGTFDTNQKSINSHFENIIQIVDEIQSQIKNRALKENLFLGPNSAISDTPFDSIILIGSGAIGPRKKSYKAIYPSEQDVDLLFVLRKDLLGYTYYINEYISDILKTLPTVHAHVIGELKGNFVSSGLIGPHVLVKSYDESPRYVHMKNEACSSAELLYNLNMEKT